MAREIGREARKRFLLERMPAAALDVARRAGRAGGKVIADEARSNARSEEVREGVQVRTKAIGPVIQVWITVKPGWAKSLAIWQEYGTAAHFITVDDSQREGMTPARINRLEKAGTLVINGKPVGATVHHPGARAFPFLRPAIDTRMTDAIAAMQASVDARRGHNGGPDEDDA